MDEIGIGAKSEHAGRNGEIEIKALRESQKGENMPPEIISGHSVLCEQKLYVMHVNKGQVFKWIFTVKTVKGLPILLRRILLLESHMPEYSISNVTINFHVQKLQENCQFWEHCDLPSKISSAQFSISFVSLSYGNFEQKLILEFDKGNKLLRNIGIQVLPERKLMESFWFGPTEYEESELSWIKNHTITPFYGEAKIESQHLNYQLPPSMNNLVSFGALDNFGKEVTKENYRERLHLLLHLEECERRQELQKLSFELEDVKVYVSEPIPGLHRNRILKIPSHYYYTEQAYRLMGTNGKALIKFFSSKVFEIYLEKILSNEYVFEMSSALDEFLQRQGDGLKAVICFRFDDVFHVMHDAVEKIVLDDVFPTHAHCKDNWAANRHKDLNKEQSSALSRMIERQSGPPVLLLGPFGSGKTRTMAHAVIALYETMKTTKQYDKRILICTHSNSAADHYIEDFLHPHLEADNPERPVLIRIHWELRYTASVSPVVLHYCKVSHGKFVQPTKEQIESHLIVVTTLVTSNVLRLNGLGKDFFSHIFIDEAAQATEAEAIIPLMLKGKQTKVILAGDHLQLGAPLSSSTARNLGFGVSLLERLFQEYPSQSPYRLKLLENHRSFPEIVEISSVLFYENSLLSNIERPPELQYPVRFYGIRGKEEMSQSHPSIYNRKEAHEVLQRIRDLIDNWPGCLGTLTHSRICVLSCFTAQIQEIRLLLRRNSLPNVRVENVTNVQGLEFDVIVVSTVRCYKELSQEMYQRTELGFRSSPKLFNTAITRAKYLCIIIGEPISLCSFGPCKAIWKTVLAICNRQGAFHHSLPYAEMIDMSNKLQQSLNEDPAVQFRLSGKSFDDFEDCQPDILMNKCRTFSTSLPTASIRSLDSKSRFQNSPIESSKMEFCDLPNENSIPASPTPTQVSFFSGSSFHLAATENAGLSEMAPFNAAESYRENEGLISRSLSARGANEQENSFDQIPSYHAVHDSFASTLISPAHLLSPFEKNELCHEAQAASAIAKLFLFREHAVCFVKSCTRIVRFEFDAFFRDEDHFIQRIQRLQNKWESCSKDFFFRKIDETSLFFSSEIRKLDAMLLTCLLPISVEEFSVAQKDFNVFKGKLYDSQIRIEIFIDNLSQLKPSPLPHSFEPILSSARRLHRKLMFTFDQLTTDIGPHLKEECSPQSGSLGAFKLSFLVKNFEVWEKELSGLEDQSAELEAKFTSQIEMTESANIELTPNRISRVEGNERGYEEIHAPIDGMDEMIDELDSLTAEDPFIEHPIDTESLITNLRHSDSDINDWFIDRKKDLIVKQYIDCFERFRAQHSIVVTTQGMQGKDPIAADLPPNAPPTAGEKEEWKKFTAMNKWKMQPPYEQYQKSKSDHQLEGTMTFERGPSLHQPLGTIMLGKSRVYFPDLRSISRSMEGDQVRFKIVGTYFEGKKGQVTQVIKRCLKKIPCKVSRDSNLLYIPVDERGPPIIALNGSEQKPSDRFVVGKRVCNYSVKVVGWPVDMKFPMGLIERPAQEHSF